MRDDRKEKRRKIVYLHRAERRGVRMGSGGPTQGGGKWTGSRRNRSDRLSNEESYEHRRCRRGQRRRKQGGAGCVGFLIERERETSVKRYGKLPLRKLGCSPRNERCTLVSFLFRRLKVGGGEDGEVQVLRTL